jgi:hypothetical protein
MQQSLFDLVPIPKARTSDPDTSHLAAASITEHQVTAVQQSIIDVLHHYGAATDEQIAERHTQLRVAAGWSRVSPSGLRSRRAELVAAGIVIDTGRRGITSAGRATIIWGLAHGA